MIELPENPTLAELKSVMSDPSYWREHNPQVIQYVRQEFDRLYFPPPETEPNTRPSDTTEQNTSEDNMSDRFIVDQENKTLRKVGDTVSVVSDGDIVRALKMEKLYTDNIKRLRAELDEAKEANAKLRSGMKDVTDRAYAIIAWTQNRAFHPYGFGLPTNYREAAEEYLLFGLERSPNKDGSTNLATKLGFKGYEPQASNG